MSGKSTGLGVIVLACFVSTPPITLAGGQLPAWTEDVLIQLNTDPNTGAYTTLVQQIPSNGPFCVFDATSPKYGYFGLMEEALVDYQGNPGRVSLQVTYAAWAFDTTYGPGVPLYVDVLPGSAQPPQFQGLSPFGAGGGDGFSIPPGDYSSAPFDITLDATNTGGGVCFLLSTENSSAFGAPTILGTALGAAAVPEPASLLTMAVGIAGVALACAARRVRGRLFSA